MSHPLAIFVRQFISRSETFIRRHVEDVLPGKAVTVVTGPQAPQPGDLRVNSPILALQRCSPGDVRRVIRAIARRCGRQTPSTHDDQRWFVKRFLNKYQVQVILGQYLDTSLPWLEVAQELGLRFFVHGHGIDVSARLRDPKLRSAYLQYNQADGVITVSQASKDRLVEIGLSPAKVHVVPCGIDIPVKAMTRAARGTVHCLAVGRMTGKKAPILLLDAFRRAAEACPALRLDYLGAGPLMPAARQFIRAFHLEEQVTLHGGQPSEAVFSLMRKADIFLQHSMTDPDTGDEEGLPVSILEAMAHGLPVISTRHAGIPEAVLEGDTGYLVNEGDSTAMAERIVALACDPDVRCRMGEAGWSRAQTHYSWEQERMALLRILGLSHQATRN